MKKLLAITALTVLTASSAFATTSHQAWRGQDLQGTRRLTNWCLFA